MPRKSRSQLKRDLVYRTEFWEREFARTGGTREQARVQRCRQAAVGGAQLERDVARSKSLLRPVRI